MNYLHTYDLKSKTVLIVDDTPDNLTLLNALLNKHYKVKIALNGRQALEIIAKSEPDLILLDVMMPEMDGYETCKRIKSNPTTRQIPIIFLTAKSLQEDEEKGFLMGAVDYITKPISPPIVLARVRSQLLLKSANDVLRDQNHYLEEEVQRRSRQLMQIKDVTILSMASLAETRDNETGSHIVRTQYYVLSLGKKLQQNAKYRDRLDSESLDLMFKSAPLHDIGKIGIPDHILLKPGKLEPEEFEIMKKHPQIGKDAIEKSALYLDQDDNFLHYASEIAYCHHEKWDGSGYPNRLSGEDIPLSARIMAIADVYDALISKRVYKTSFTHEEAMKTIIEGKGSHFDPELIDAFMEIAEEFRMIAQKYAEDT